MKRVAAMLLVGLVLVLTLVFYHGSNTRSQTTSRTTQKVTPTPAAQLAQANTIQVQQRVNKYLYSEVIPKLKDCWRTVRGQGSIEIKHTFVKSGATRWLADKVETQSSTLPENEQTISLRCMQVATGGTSFQAETKQTTLQTYVIYWTWPVPLPTNLEATKAAMFARRPKTGGGCDGRGSQPRCWTCVEGKCERTCTGSADCARGVYSCLDFGDCSTGGPVVLGGTKGIQ